MWVYLHREVSIAGVELLIVICLVKVAFKSQPVVVLLEGGHEVAASVQVIHLRSRSYLMWSLSETECLEVLGDFLDALFLTQVRHQVLFGLGEQASIGSWLDHVLVINRIHGTLTLMKRFVETLTLLLQCRLWNDVVGKVVLIVPRDMAWLPVACAKQVNSIDRFVYSRLLL